MRDIHMCNSAGASEDEILKGCAKHKKKECAFLKDFTKKD